MSIKTGNSWGGGGGSLNLFDFWKWSKFQLRYEIQINLNREAPPHPLSQCFSRSASKKAKYKWLLKTPLHHTPPSPIEASNFTWSDRICLTSTCSRIWICENATKRKKKKLCTIHDGCCKTKWPISKFYSEEWQTKGKNRCQFQMVHTFSVKSSAPLIIVVSSCVSSPPLPA